MTRTFLLAATCATLGLAACDDTALPVAGGDAEEVSEQRGLRSCLRAVKDHTGVDGVSPSTTIPVIEVNQHVIDVPGGPSWRCFTDDSGKAQELIEVRAG